MDIQAEALRYGFQVVEDEAPENEKPDRLKKPPDIRCTDCGQVRRPHMMTCFAFEKPVKVLVDGKVKRVPHWRCPACHAKRSKELYIGAFLEEVEAMAAEGRVNA